VKTYFKNTFPKNGKDYEKTYYGKNDTKVISIKYYNFRPTDNTPENFTPIINIGR
jgi:hypothetical protein